METRFLEKNSNVSENLLRLSAVSVTVKTFFVALILIGLANSTAFSQTFAGTNTGAIADGMNPQGCAAGRDVQFNVSGAIAPISSVTLSLTAAHTWVGDLSATLIAPDGTSFVVFDRVGKNFADDTDWGDDSELDGTYNFADSAPNNFWAAADAALIFDLVEPQSYRTQAAAPYAANDNPGPALTNLSTAFINIPQTSVNGIWVLRVRDCAAGDTGTVTAASLGLFAPTSAPATISGQVLSGKTGLRGVRLMLSGGSLTEPVYAVTNSFGRYSFQNVQSGNSYVVTAFSNKYSITNPTQFVYLNENVGEINFEAQE